MDILFPKVEYDTRSLNAIVGVDAACGQCVGDRDEQQDACGLFTHGFSLLAVVADGMGGLARGGAAARLALESAQREAQTLLAGGVCFESMKRALEAINGEIYHSIRSFGAVGMAGTTLCAAVLEGRRLRLFWSGDSRTYLFRGGRLELLTEDHVYARYLREMVVEGVIGERDAQTHPRRGHLTGYLGMRALEDYSITPAFLELTEGDGLLLCTDGLYKCLDETQICRCMGNGAQQAADALIRQIVKKRLPRQDNATALVLKFH